MCGDQQIVGTDHFAPLFEIGPDLGVMRRRLVGKVEDEGVTKKSLDGRAVLMPPRRNLASV
jgi:hypothetical protein